MVSKKKLSLFYRLKLVILDSPKSLAALKVRRTKSISPKVSWP